MNIENMTFQEIYDGIKSGKISYKEFDTWVTDYGLKNQSEGYMNGGRDAMDFIRGTYE